MISIPCSGTCIPLLVEGAASNRYISCCISHLWSSPHLVRFMFKRGGYTGESGGKSIASSRPPSAVSALKREQSFPLHMCLIAPKHFQCRNTQVYRSRDTPFKSLPSVYKPSTELVACSHEQYSVKLASGQHRLHSNSTCQVQTPYR